MLPPELQTTNALPAETPLRAVSATCSDDELRVTLGDGRWLSVPLAWFPRLAHASASDRSNYELLGEGQGIHWPDIDEDITERLFNRHRVKRFVNIEAVARRKLE